MSEIIDKTYKLLDTLDNSKLIKDLTLYKKKIINDKHILSLVKQYNEEVDNNKLINIKKELYQNKDYYNYQTCYNELYFIILRINKKYAEYTKTKEHHHE